MDWEQFLYMDLVHLYPMQSDIIMLKCRNNNQNITTNKNIKNKKIKIKIKIKMIKPNKHNKIN